MQSLWMLLASLLFALMGVCVKLASATFSTSEIVMCRGAFGVVLMLVISRVNRTSLATTMPMRHLWRGLVGVIALWLWFYAISQLPLSLANTLNYLSPIWIAVILFGSHWWRRRTRDRRPDHGSAHRPGRRLDSATTIISAAMPAAILLSFIGVVCLLRPSLHADQLPAAMIALGSGILAALAYLQVREMGLLGEPETRVVFYFSLTGMIWGASLCALQGQWHRPQGWSIVQLLLVGLFASTAQLAMTRAYRLGNPLLTANLSYTGIVFSSVLGVLIWDEQLGWISWMGIAMILISGILATCVQSGIRRAASAQD